MMREVSKVHFENKGKLRGKEIGYCEEVSKDRERHRQLLADVTKQLHCSGGRCGEENCALCRSVLWIIAGKRLNDFGKEFTCKRRRPFLKGSSPYRVGEKSA
jgi:hypothetical protein